MRAVVIGGTGHIGTYLIPGLVELGYEVTCVSLKDRSPFQEHKAWNVVKQIEADRIEDEKKGAFGARIAALSPDVVIDLICFTADSAREIVTALSGKVRHYLQCGSMWVHGHSTQVPATEALPRHPFCEYGKNKAAVEAYLLAEAQRTGFPATVVHPGHLVGPGWAPVNPAGNFNVAVFEKIARGEELSLPNFGMETVHHAHAQDVAQVFLKSIINWNTSVGESFQAVSPGALTLRGYAEAMYAWFGQTPNLRFMPWEQWKTTVSEDDVRATEDHIRHSPNGSIAKGQRLINYCPRYTSLQAIQESVQWLIDHKKLKI
ncbi:MAG: NAD-dependent epimerase/dehydratase family protein [Chitinivibrionales bacterium]|nr:NAD-dependent epimerase/dehydratase family protein [Chitinivibrionales bacterium]